MAKRVITFGEIMMRLNPIGYLRLVQSDRFEATYAGGEANVAVSLANYGLDAVYVTKVPAHEVGQCAVNELRRYGVDTQYMVRGGDRLGIYFCEKGASQRASKVIYDRASSAIALAKRTDFDWDTIFDGADWFHWTGITPALGGELPEICLDACKAAKARGLTISCDLNFRKKLWTSQRAGEVMSQLLPYVDVCIANEEDAKDVFGIEAEGTDINSGKLNRDGYISGVAALCAVRLCPAAEKAVFASHCSTEPAAKLVLDALNKKALITAGLHLGEGTGAVAAIPLWDMALAVYDGCYSFAEGGIDAYTPQGGAGC